MKNYTLENYTCQLFGCTVDELYSKVRLRQVVSARQVCMVMMREFTTMSMRQIAERYGLGHCMVIHSQRVVENYCDTEKDFREKVDKIRRACLCGLPVLPDYMDEVMTYYADLV